MQRYLLLLALLWLVPKSFAQKITYSVDATEAHTHNYNVSLDLVYKNAPDSVVLKMATWTPGSYLIREFAKHVNAYHAIDSEGDTLEVYKIDKNTWVIRTKGHKKLKFEYRVYAHQLNVRMTYLDADLGLINGASLFIYPQNSLESPTTINLLLPEDWKVSSTLKQEGKSGLRFSAPNYDFLFDNPMFLGTHEEYSFEAAGVKHRFAINGPANYDINRIEEDIRKIVEIQTDVFDENPNDEYLFIVITRQSGGGGLEHAKSTTLIVDRLNLSEQRGCNRFLGLVAHEYFHLWNVKRLRAKSLGPFDYEKENYTDLLWLMEGVTTYYGAKTMLKAGFSEENGFMNRIVNSINSQLSRPGDQVQSLAESSMDAWIKFYRGDENDYNSTVSYYGKGYLIGALLDMILIRDTDGEKCLDDLMKDLYVTFYKNQDTGITSEDVISRMNVVGGKDYSEFFKKSINGTDFPDIASIMEPFGYEVSLNEVSDSDLGFITREEDQHYFVRRINSGSPAFHSGLNVGDEIIAVENHVFNNRTIENFKGTKEETDSLSFLVIRNGLVKSIEVPLMPSEKKEYRIRPKSNPSQSEQKLLDRFLMKS